MQVRWSRVRRTAVLTPVVLAAAVSPALAATTAASPARWHIAATYPVGSQLDSVSSDSSHDAWLAGMSATSGLLIRHWNGTKWVAASPAGVSSVGSAVIAASSARTAWAFADVSGSSQYTLALHRSGNGWVRYRFANGSSISAAAVFNPTDAWAFGESFGTSLGSYVRHFNGKRWSNVATPIAPNDASAVSASDIWAAGQTTASLGKPRQVFAAAVWTRGSWHLRSLPRLRLPAGTSVFNPHVVALGPSNVWVDLDLSKGEGAYPGAILLHYNGRKWTRVTVPYSATFMLTNLASDGRGGIWIAATQRDGLTQYMYELRAGHWSKAETPSQKGDVSQVQAVALRKGTTEVWAAGDMVPLAGGSTQGVLLANRG
jgi:hypothetical protein